MDEKELKQFLEWIPTKVKELKGKSLEEVSKALNSLYQTDQGKKTVEALVTTYQKEKTPTKFKNGGKTTKKCKCGCDIISKHENGGLIETCACGCKSNVVKGETGTKIPIQSQRSNDWFKPNMSEYKSTPGYYKGDYNATQVQGDNALYRQLSRKNGHYNNVTSQIIRNPNTPKADTIYVSPKGNTSTPQQSPVWTNTFNNIFGYKSGGILSAKSGIKVDKKVTEGKDDKGNKTATKVKTVTNNTTGRVEKKVKTRTMLSGNKQAFDKTKTIGYQDESQVPNRYRTKESANVNTGGKQLPDFKMSKPSVSINVPQQTVSSISAIPQPRQHANIDFNSAFGNARKQGLSEFEWNGKRYGTQLKGETNNVSRSPIISNQPTKVATQPKMENMPVSRPVSQPTVTSNPSAPVANIPVSVPVTSPSVASDSTFNQGYNIPEVTIRPRAKSTRDPIEVAAERIRNRQATIKDFPREMQGPIGGALVRNGMNNSPLAKFAMAVVTAGGAGALAAAVPTLPSIASAASPVMNWVTNNIPQMYSTASKSVAGAAKVATKATTNSVAKAVGTSKNLVAGAKTVGQGSANFTPQAGRALMNNGSYMSQMWNGVSTGRKLATVGAGMDAIHTTSNKIK